MKNLLRTLFFLLILSIVFNSCDNFDDVPAENDNIYLVEKDNVGNQALSQIQLIMAILSNKYPEMAEISDKFTAPVKIYTITYNTTFNGEERLASGLVCVPNLSGTYPLMSFQNGTNTLHSAAPSVGYSSDLFQMLSMMASTGFIICIPDYLGFGEADDMFHPYLDEESTVQSVLDMMRATKELIDGDDLVDMSDDLYITGYSQGGWSTMQVQNEIEANYASEFNLVASACGGGPYNLVAITDYILSETTYPMPYFLAYIMNSYSNLGISTPIDSIFNEPYASRVPDLFDGTKDGAAINAQLTTVVADLFTPGFLENWNKGGIYEDLYDMLEANSISGYQTQIPTMLLHGTDDSFVPSFSSSNLYQEFVVAGVGDLVEHVDLVGMDHTDAIIPAELMAIMWFIELKDASM